MAVRGAGRTGPKAGRDDPRARARRDPRVAILGAGVSGIRTAVALKEAGVYDFEWNLR